MPNDPSRRSFLSAGLAMPALGRFQPTQRATPAKPPVRFRVLGKTGLKVTELGMGCEAVPDPSVVQAALDLGINFFDTARNYEGGNNEAMLGRALGARRRQVVLTSRSYGKNRNSLAADLEASLKTLGTDYLDIWYIGSKDKPADITDDMLEFQARAQKEGRIRFKGISSHRLHEMLAFATVPGRFDVLMTAYNFTMGPKFDGPLDALHKAGLGVVAMKVMAGGFVRSLRPSTRLPALKWSLRQPWVQTTAVSMRDRDALSENIRVMTEPFTDQDRDTLAASLPQVGPLVCRMCGSCDGACPRSLPVSDLVRFAMYADGYGDYRMGRAHFDALPAATRAVRCGDCAACAVRCPNGVDVRERLTHAQQLFA